MIANIAELTHFWHQSCWHYTLTTTQKLTNIFVSLQTLTPVVVAAAVVIDYCSHSSQTLSLILQVNETEMTNTYTCKTESTTDCTSTTRPDCKNISWQECRLDQSQWLGLSETSTQTSLWLWAEMQPWWHLKNSVGMKFMSWTDFGSNLARPFLPQR